MVETSVYVLFNALWSLNHPNALTVQKVIKQIIGKDFAVLLPNKEKAGREGLPQWDRSSEEVNAHALPVLWLYILISIRLWD